MLEKIENIWANNIKSDFEAELINSEKCLQAILYMHLRNVFSKDIYKIFVEPRIFFEKDQKILIPDIIICNEDTIEYVFEIKFSPHWYPKFENDIKKFNDLYENKDFTYRVDISSPNHIYNNKTKNWIPPMPKFKITIDTTFIIVVIGRHDSIFFDKKKRKELSDKYITLRELRLYLLKGATQPEEKIYLFNVEEFL